MLRVSILVALISGLNGSQFFAQQGNLADDIRLRLAELSKPGGNVIGGEVIVAAKFLRAFYQEPHFQAAWRDSANSAALVKEIEESRNDGQIIEVSSKDYVDTMINGLGHWIAAAQQGHLAWGILCFGKTADIG
jgi:hypothetical protein